MTIEEMFLDASPLWLLPILGAIVMVSQAMPNLIGKWGESWSAWTKHQRSAEKEARASRDEERDYWRGVADERLREMQARDKLNAAHVDWDREVQQAMIENGLKFTQPPPLFPRLRSPGDRSAPPASEH